MDGAQHDFKDLPQVYCKAWANRDPTDLLSLFADDSVMTDHGAQIHVPRNFLERHHKHWNGAHENFEVYLEYDSISLHTLFQDVCWFWVPVVCGHT